MLILQRYQVALVFAISFVVLFCRRPEILLHAQFWAEDGAVWYYDAYRLGPIQALTLPQNGYLQTVSRIVFGITQFVPLEWAPTLANTIGLVIRCALPAFLFSKRFAWVDDRAKLAVLTYFLLMPGLEEVHANITNAHWYLGLYLMMVIIADRPHSIWQKVHDYAALVLVGMSGPFILFLAPCFLLRDWNARRLSVFTIVAALLGALQAVSILLGLGNRAVSPLGANFMLFVQIIVERIIVGFAIPFDWSPIRGNQLYAALIAAGTVVILWLIMRRADWRIWCIAIFPTLLMAASLAKPAMSNEQDQWPLFLTGGSRYFVAPSIALACILIFGVSLLKLKTRYLLVFLLIPIAMYQYFRIEPLPDYGFQQQVAEFRALPAGASYEFQFPPVGWKMTLTR